MIKLKSLLTEFKDRSLSKFLALVLRHKPEKIGIFMDSAGWVDVNELLQKCKLAGVYLTMNMLINIVKYNDKKRFEFNTDRTKIRASQGHSLNVDLQYTPQISPPVLYHGTGQQNIESIKSFGINKGTRTHVHLSSDMSTAQKVGSRHGNPIVFIINAGKNGGGWI